MRVSEGWRRGFTPTPTCETQNGEACRELPPSSPAASPGMGGLGTAGLPRGRDPARDPRGSCSNSRLSGKFLLGQNPGHVKLPCSHPHFTPVLWGHSSTKACLETESYPQPENGNILAIRGALLAGSPHFIKLLSAMGILGCHLYWTAGASSWDGVADDPWSVLLCSLHALHKVCVYGIFCWHQKSPTTLAT